MKCSNGLILRQHIGDITSEEDASVKSVSVALPSMTLIVEFNDGTHVFWTWQELIEAAVTCHEEYKSKEGVVA